MSINNDNHGFVLVPKISVKLIIDSKPLEHVLNQTGNLVPMIKQGNLDSSEILNSEFAFN